MSNELQPPTFASANPGTAAELDLSDIFSDYFIQEYQPPGDSGNFASNFGGLSNFYPHVPNDGLMTYNSIPDPPATMPGQKQTSGKTQHPPNPYSNELVTNAVVANSTGPLTSRLGFSNGVMSHEPEPEVPPTSLVSRRERNREHAKKSRARKKFMLESLQQEVRELQRENLTLRMDIQTALPHTHREILAGIGRPNILFRDDDEAELSEEEESASGDSKTTTEATSVSSSAPSRDVSRDLPTKITSHDYSLVNALATCQQNFVLSDPTLPDNPIVFASPGFYELTGYKANEVLGRNCRFLQGEKTDPKAIDVIRKAVANGTDASVCMLNYKADGTPFWNQFFIAALRNEDDAIVNFMGVQCQVKEQVFEGVEDKVNERLPLKKESS